MATAKIDSLDKEIIWLESRLVISDSLRVYDKQDLLAHIVRIEAWGDKGWKRADSWWHQNKSAFWACIAFVAAAVGFSGL